VGSDEAIVPSRFEKFGRYFRLGVFVACLPCSCGRRAEVLHATARPRTTNRLDAGELVDGSHDAGRQPAMTANTGPIQRSEEAGAQPRDASISDAVVDGDASAEAPDSAAVHGDATRFITRVVSFTPGPGAGFGQDRMPAIVYGPPVGGGLCAGSTDVVSLGAGGEIVVEFTENAIVDGPGPDLLVFGNPFDIGCNDPTHVYAKPAEVSVSDDGRTWATFPCNATTYPYGSCAGWHPVLSAPANGISPFDPAKAGGDPFDLSDVGVAHARFVRVRDMMSDVDAHGFNLDAMAILNPESN
jgi:hypothetical protein